MLPALYYLESTPHLRQRHSAVELQELFARLRHNGYSPSGTLARAYEMIACTVAA